MSTSRVIRRPVLVALALVMATTAGLASPTPSLAVPFPPPPPPPAEGFVDTAVPDLLGRPPTAAERARWIAELGAGRTRAHLAHALAHRFEHTRRVVADLYRRALGRDPEPAGRTFWAARLSTGTPLWRLAAEVYGSAEAYDRAGGTPQAYVEATYQALLGRAAEPAGLAHWSARLAAGTPRTTLARALYLTVESNRLRAELAFIALLRRPPRDADRAYWGARLRTVDDLTLAGRLVASEEYLERVARWPGGPRPPKVADGFDPSTSADGRYIAHVTIGGDVGLFDRLTGRRRVLAAGNGQASHPELSADGSVVAFSSTSSNLVAGDANGEEDIFLVRRTGGPARRLTDGDGPSTEPTVSGDGRTVAFTSTATDLVSGGTDGTADVYVMALDGAGSPTAVERVGGDGPSREPELSADGTALVFDSAATDLVSGDDNGWTDPFWVRLPLAGATYVRLAEAHELYGTLPPGAAEGPSVSADGLVVGYLRKVAAGGVVDQEAQVARLAGGAVVDRRTLSPPDQGYEVGVGLSDDGTATLTFGVRDVMSRPVPFSLFAPTPEVEPTELGPDGAMSADGSVVVYGTARFFPDPGTAIRVLTTS